jgi:hypothetical protein
MSGAPLPKKFLILLLILPVALLLGYMLAGPLDYSSIVVYAGILGVILLPIVLQYHHMLLVLSLNATIDIFFLPGKPHLWMLLALVSLGVTFVSRILNKEMRLIHVPSVTWALIAMVVVVALTAKLTGGLGMRSLGGASYGGKRYVFITFALAVYLAVSLVRISPDKARLYVGLYFLSTLTSAMSNLIYSAGVGWWWLYYFLPSDWALSQAQEDFSVGFTGVRMSRLSGFNPAAQALICYLIVRFGIRGIFDFSKPWRFIVFLLTGGLCLLSGFRSGILLIGMICGIQFFLEGLVRTRLALVLLLTGILGFAAVLPFAQHLPLSVQRSLSVLPLVEVDAAVLANARESTEWRLKMWEVLLPQIPKYFWLGKGHSASEADYFLAAESVKRGLARDYEVSLLAGDYHNGPLTVILPFGVWGCLAFLAFLIAGFRVLHANYHHGDPALKSINTLLFSFFLAKVAFFFSIYGELHVDLPNLAGLVALSVSLNGGMARAAAPKPLPAERKAPSAAVAPFRPVRA